MRLNRWNPESNLNKFHGSESDFQWNLHGQWKTGSGILWQQGTSQCQVQGCHWKNYCLFAGEKNLRIVRNLLILVLKRGRGEGIFGGLLNILWVSNLVLGSQDCCLYEIIYLFLHLMIYHKVYILSFSSWIFFWTSFSIISFNVTKFDILSMRFNYLLYKNLLNIIRTNFPITLFQQSPKFLFNFFFALFKDLLKLPIFLPSINLWKNNFLHNLWPPNNRHFQSSIIN